MVALADCYGASKQARHSHEETGLLRYRSGQVTPCAVADAVQGLAGQPTRYSLSPRPISLKSRSPRLVIQ